MTGFVRTYDSNGQLIEEEPIWENPAALFCDKIPAERRHLEQLKQLSVALVTMMTGNAGTQHTYDSQNRLRHTRERNSWFGSKKLRESPMTSAATKPRSGQMSLKTLLTIDPFTRPQLRSIPWR